MANLTKSDILAWDSENWAKALDFWEKRIPSDLSGKTCLELGANKGGLSLWLAEKGAQVLCSDQRETEERASPLHQQYNPKGKIFYENIDARDIPYSGAFDLIVFKSILGGIARMGHDERREEVISEIHRSLKPGGLLLFSENLQATGLHGFMRKNFTKWGAEWNYLKLKDGEALLENFNTVQSSTTGLLGAFGRGEGMRRALGKLDQLLSPIVPASWNYIWFGVARK